MPSSRPVESSIPTSSSASDLLEVKAQFLPVPLLDFSREYEAIGAELLAAVQDVFASQRYVLGPQVATFEAAAAQACHIAEAVGCGSGTDALWLAMAAAGVTQGDRVATTPFSFFATVSSILRLGARPVLADIDPATFNLSAAAVARIQESSSEPLKAILPVHLYGQTANWDAMEGLRKRYGCLLIEDAAQAFGASWKGRPAGSLGDAAAFSFYPTKNLSAAGEAGMVTTGDPVLAERARMLRAHGMRKRYYHDEVGWNSRLDTLQAAVLLVKLRYIDDWNQRRRALAANYDQLFRDAGLAEAGTYPEHGVVLPFVSRHATHVFHQYVVRIKRRDALRSFLAEHKIGSEVYYPVPLHLQEALRGLGHKAGDFPESERAAAELLALPIFPQLREDEQASVVAAIATFLS
jgi:dTDP-4-amino-4,6-dideoxygalactose transaminase